MVCFLSGERMAVNTQNTGLGLYRISRVRGGVKTNLFLSNQSSYLDVYFSNGSTFGIEIKSFQVDHTLLKKNLLLLSSLLIVERAFQLSVYLRTSKIQG